MESVRLPVVRPVLLDSQLHFLQDRPPRATPTRPPAGEPPVHDRSRLRRAPTTRWCPPSSGGRPRRPGRAGVPTDQWHIRAAATSARDSDVVALREPKCEVQVTEWHGPRGSVPTPPDRSEARDATGDRDEGKPGGCGRVGRRSHRCGVVPVLARGERARAAGFRQARPGETPRRQRRGKGR
jgi:hypothetical protein